ELFSRALQVKRELFQIVSKSNGMNGYSNLGGEFTQEALIGWGQALSRLSGREDHFCDLFLLIHEGHKLSSRLLVCRAIGSKHDGFSACILWRTADGGKW